VYAETVTVTRQNLFDSDMLQVGGFDARPATDACSEVEWQPGHAVVLPFAGVFAKHDAPGRHVIGTPSHAVFFAPELPYRIGFPGAIGDRALTLRFSGELAPEWLDRRGPDRLLPSAALLPGRAMVLRDLLRTRLASGAADRLETEALSLELLGVVLQSLRPAPRAATKLRHARAVERVKEAVALAPADNWSVARLARTAYLSPFHLCRVFRDMTGTSLHDYVVRERLAQSLDAVLDRAGNLTAIGLDAGFASHSHFTARFRRFFGCTPAALRQRMTTARRAEIRKIMTAARSPSALD